jgi:hypothetical protein
MAIVLYGPDGLGASGDVWRFIAALQIELDELAAVSAVADFDGGFPDTLFATAAVDGGSP